MFPQTSEIDLPALLGGNWSFLGCASFETRWEQFAKLAVSRGLSPSYSQVLFPADTGSAFRLECSRLQQESWEKSLVNVDWAAQRADLELLMARPWEIAKRAVDELLTSMGTGALVLDITTMPRVCLCPAVATALQDNRAETLLVSYVEPRSYSGKSLHSEPTGPVIVPPFDRIGIGRKEAAWLPIFGFGPSFAAEIYESIASMFDLGSRVYPLFGFPAFTPLSFERALDEGASVLQNSNVERDQFLYADASDPFETRATILRLMEATDDVMWIGSPLGSKPMTLGMILAAVDSELSIMINQPRTYIPDYSTGAGKVHLYVLRHQGKRTY